MKIRWRRTGGMCAEIGLYLHNHYMGGLSKLLKVGGITKARIEEKKGSKLKLTFSFGGACGTTGIH